MRLLPALALSASIALGGCQNPDGSTDWGSTAALGIGAAAIGGLIAVAASSNDNDGYRRQGRYRSRGPDRYASWERQPYRNRW
ncbi:hypothetical protein KPL78_18365 [Roseomonas sp. HJA6]|uniref:Lipoprotein n=1 Tax=Roseomonas alba TaxID=2846776 RepID=A0ABS7AF91_9PROT|nr:hypothetical protein [Neoroseomonas alba]MBW6399829.1 hypothetical protein [Neoroseomonas alba]